MIERTVLETPIGPLLLAASAKGLVAVAFDASETELARALARHPSTPLAGGSAILERARAAHAAYFKGELHALDDLPLDIAGTPFQQSVWLALRSIPCGSTASYAELAARIGSPSAVRAVGAANGQNPVPLVLPCHRVIGTNGTLTGYGGGIERKRWLLVHEGVLLA